MNAAENRDGIEPPLAQMTIVCDAVDAREDRSRDKRRDGVSRPHENVRESAIAHVQQQRRVQAGTQVVIAQAEGTSQRDGERS